MTRAVATALALAVLSAACLADPDDGAGDGFDEPCGKCDGATPDGRQIAARLTRPVELRSAADPATGRAYCTVPAGEVQVARFEHGQYRVYLPGRAPCAAGVADSYRGWVPADAVAIEDGAYFGKLRRVTPNSKIDVRMSYAGDEIFCTPTADGRRRCLIDEPLYGMDRCYVHPALHARLQSAAIALDKKLPGAKLALLDCYRPVYVQQRMAALVSDPTWVAQPSPGHYGAHNSGRAVDLSLLDARGQPVDMGSGFDEFSARSNYAAAGLTASQRANRKLLRDVMTAAGLSPYDAEWWHFSLAIAADPLDLAL